MVKAETFQSFHLWAHFSLKQWFSNFGHLESPGISFISPPGDLAAYQSLQKQCSQ